MRIIQLAQKPQLRGAEVFASQLSRWLTVRGHQTLTIYLYQHAGAKLALQPSDRTIDAREDHPLERFAGFNPSVAHQIRKIIDEFGPDIVQVNGARSVKYGALIKRLQRRPRWGLVYRNIDSPRFWLRGRIKTGLYKTGVMRAMDGVVGVSQQTLDEVLSTYRLAVPHELIPNGVDLSLLDNPSRRAQVRDSLATPHAATVVIFVGNLGPQKRPDRFLRVIAEASRKNPTIHAWLLGDGNQRAVLEKQASDLGIADRVAFLGYRADVASFIAAADIFMLTSDTEGTPAVVLEVGYLSLPTIAARVGGIPECVLDGETGLLVEPGDESALTQVLLQLSRDSVLRRRLGANAKTHIKSRYCMDRIGQSYLLFYDRLLGEMAADR